MSWPLDLFSESGSRENLVTHSRPAPIDETRLTLRFLGPSATDWPLPPERHSGASAFRRAIVTRSCRHRRTCRSRIYSRVEYSYAGGAGRFDRGMRDAGCAYAGRIDGIFFTPLPLIAITSLRLFANF